MDPKDTAKLIIGCLAGDELAVEQLLCQYQTAVFKLTLSVLSDPSEAAEVTQDAFITALSSLKSYREKSSFKAWLYTIALNLSRSRLRKRKTAKKLENILRSLFQIQLQHSTTPEEVVLRNERDHTMLRALETLDEKHRIPIVLRYFHDLSVAEIAEILKIKQGTIHSRLHTGRERLRAELERYAELDGE
jgi:RNA polymerase sigma-70 factor (ECF subfamily)